MGGSIEYLAQIMLFTIYLTIKHSMSKKSSKSSREGSVHESPRSTPTKKQKSKSQRNGKDQKICIHHLSQAFYPKEQSRSVSKIVFFDQF